MRSKSWIVLMTVAMVLAAVSDGAAERMGGGRLMGPPTFLRHLFRPELVMQHQSEIALSDAQRARIQAAMRETSEAISTLRWDYEAAAEKLSALIEVPKIDEDAALGQAEQVMAIEQRIKRAHLGLLVRIKNALSAEQQAQLQALQPKRQRPFGGGTGH